MSADHTISSEEYTRKLYLFRRRKALKRKDEHVEVDLSPLIDAVFLLLIFFLVSTILKRLEKQIPVTLPDTTASIDQVSQKEEVIYVIETDGDIRKTSGELNRWGKLSYKKVEDFAAELKNIAEKKGLDVPIRIDAYRNIGFQKIIDIMDTLNIQGFNNISVRLAQQENLYFKLGNSD